jgi:hypothetical protein
MRGIGYERIKRGVLVASVGASFLLPVTAAQASPPAWAPAPGYWTYGAGGQSGSTGQSGDRGGRSGAKISGHKIG